MGAASGTLWADAPRAGTQSVQLPVQDAGSGVAKVVLYVDGTARRTQEVSCAGV